MRPGRRTAVLLALATAAGAPSAGVAQEPALDYGPHGVGFRVIEAYDSTRAFRPKRDFRGRRTADETARPVQISLWYPAVTDANDDRMAAGEFRLLRETELEFRPLGPAVREAVRRDFIRTAGLFGIEETVARALLDDPTPAVREARPTPAAHPTVLYFTAAGVSNPLLPAYLASHGFVVASFPSNGRMTETSLEFTPNALTLDTDIDDAGFVYAHLRRLPIADTDRFGLISFSSGSLAALLWQMRDLQADAIVAVEGWERFRRGVDIVRESVHYDPVRVRVPYLILERAQPEISPRYAKVPDVVGAMELADITRVPFRDAEHVDFLSHGVSEGSTDRGRVYEIGARMVRLFLQAHLTDDDGAAARLARLSPPAGLGQDFFTIERSAARPPVPSEGELFRLAEVDPDSVAALYRELTERTQSAGARSDDMPGGMADDTVDAGHRLFREHVLTRAATFAGSPEDRATVMRIVVDAYPRSVGAAYRLADALREAGRTDEARAAYERALERLPLDPSLDESGRADWRRRIAEAIAELDRTRSNP